MVGRACCNSCWLIITHGNKIGVKEFPEPMKQSGHYCYTPRASTKVNIEANSRIMSTSSLGTFIHLMLSLVFAA